MLQEVELEIARLHSRVVQRNAEQETLTKKNRTLQERTHEALEQCGYLVNMFEQETKRIVREEVDNAVDAHIHARSNLGAAAEQLQSSTVLSAMRQGYKMEHETDSLVEVLQQAEVSSANSETDSAATMQLVVAVNMLHERLYNLGVVRRDLKLNESLAALKVVTKEHEAVTERAMQLLERCRAMRQSGVRDALQLSAQQMLDALPRAAVSKYKAPEGAAQAQAAQDRLMMDSNNDGVVDTDEFLAAGGSKEEFQQYDLNNDGVLSRQEMELRAEENVENVLLQKQVSKWLARQCEAICYAGGSKPMLLTELNDSLLVGACARLLPPCYVATCPITEIIDEWMAGPRCVPMIIYGEPGLGKVSLDDCILPCMQTHQCL